MQEDETEEKPLRQFVNHLYLQLVVSVRTYVRDGNGSRMRTLPDVL